MAVNLNQGRLRELLAESDDLHAAARAGARRDLNAYVDAAQQARYESRHDLRAVTGSVDVLALQTAASFENLAVATYKRALALPFVGGASANAVVQAFANKTGGQHADHAKAFNASVTRLGGRAQHGPDEKYRTLVDGALPAARNAGDVVALALVLEDVAAQSYVKYVGLVSTPELRQLFASVAGVEAQHKALLLAVRALVGANASDLLAQPTDLADLPVDAGGTAFPDAFFPTAKASAVSEGALR